MQDWQYEPNEEDIEAGELYPRYIRRMPEMGHLCGYIAVPPEHPWAIMGYEKVPCDVHGGLTYGASADDFYGGSVAPAGWAVFGFDCAHAGDMLPSTYERLKGRIANADAGVLYGEYRTIEFVRTQLLSLAKQAKEQAGPSTGIGADSIG